MIRSYSLVIAILRLRRLWGPFWCGLVQAALYLIAFFFTVAYVRAADRFPGCLQVLVYIGAVAILLMFGIMLTTTSGR